jgi:hypothetical protein
VRADLRDLSGSELVGLNGQQDRYASKPDDLR